MDNFNVDYSCQGIDGAINTGELHKVSLDYIVMYGLRRAIQDRVNSAAHLAKKAGEAFNAADAVESILKALREGTLAKRREGGRTSGLLSYIRKVIEANLDAKDQAMFAEITKEAKADWLDAKFDGAGEQTKAVIEARAAQLRDADIAAKAAEKARREAQVAAIKLDIKL